MNTNEPTGTGNERQQEENRNTESTQPSGKSRRGFASLDPERRRQIASLGGRTAHQQGVAHRWTREEAQAAGRKGQSLRRGE